MTIKQRCIDCGKLMDPEDQDYYVLCSACRLEPYEEADIEPVDVYMDRLYREHGGEG